MPTSPSPTAPHPPDPGVALVLGATGQQGGAVARALLARRWGVRALVRDPGTAAARELSALGAVLVEGDLRDARSVGAATAGAWAVFSVQPSSGQGAAHGVSDDDEVRYGTTVADAAAAHGVRHLVYSSANAAGAPTGVGHFDTKSRIEDHVRSLSVPSTILRPAAFMEILTLPGLGLDTGRLTFLMRPDQRMQFIAVQDVGRIVADVLDDPARYAGRTITVAGDGVSGNEVAAEFGRASGRTVSYLRLPDAVLDADAGLRRLADLVDAGPLAGDADLTALRAEFPGLLTVRGWLAGAGRARLLAALRATGGTVALR